MDAPKRSGRLMPSDLPAASPIHGGADVGTGLTGPPHSLGDQALASLKDRVRAAVAGSPREFWPRVVAERVQAGELEFEALGDVLHELQEPTPPGTPQKVRWRLPPRTRRNRWDKRPKIPCERWVGRISLDPVVDWSVNDGAGRCLQLIVSLAGGAGRSLVTLTSSIAKQLGRTTRTIQNYWNDLVDAGYIKHTFERRTGLVTIFVTDLVKPPPMPEVKKPWPRLPNPKAGWKRPTRGGAKLASHIKTKVMTSSLIEESVHAAEAVFHPR